MYQRMPLGSSSKTHLRPRDMKALPPRKSLPRPQVSDNGRTDAAYDTLAGDLVTKLVGTLDRVGVADLKGASRGKAGIALSRQKAMYLMHTVFSSPYQAVADYFDRDRTTISHACRLVEDLRDNEDFDLQLEAMENLLVSARQLADLADAKSRSLDGEDRPVQDRFARR